MLSTLFQKVARRAREWIAALLTQWSRKLTGHVEPRIVLPNYDKIRCEELPSFQGGAEEAAVLLEMPPVIKVERHVIADVGKNGTLPDSVEELRLTSLGLVVARTDFVIMDDHSQLGRPEQLKGCCTSCQRMSFQGAPCQMCGGFTCPGCSTLLSESQRLCPRCRRIAEANRDNWALYDQQRQCQGGPHE